MPITVHENGGMSITGEDGMFAFRLNMVYRGLKLQRDTGMRLTGKVSTLKAARDMGFVGRTCKTLIKDIESKYPQLKG
jgi:hypothetical protein